jgi:tetratricopeptide (TPR) repeat protein
MATVLYHFSDKAKAEENCREALVLDKKNWRASFLLAKVVECHSEATGILKKTIHSCEADAPWMEENQKSLAEMLYVLGKRLWDDGKFLKAIKNFTACVESDPTMHQSMLDMLSRYHSFKRWDCMIDLIEQVRSKSKLRSMAIALATHEEFHLYVRHAVVNMGRFDVLEQVYTDAIQTATKHKKYDISFNLRQSYARSLSAKLPVPINEVKNLLEAAARDVPYTNLDLAAAFFLVGYRLGTIYLDNAKAARANGKEDEANAWLRQMADIVPEQVTEDQMRLPLRLFAARYYHIYGNQEAAHSSAHNTLKIAVELLSDNDSTNDIFAYTKILYAVIPFEDVDNAAAALAMMKLEAPSFKLDCSCQCGHVWTAPGDMWWCMDCINVVLTTQCKQDVKDPKVIKGVCHESHTHFHIPKWNDEMMKNAPKDLVPWKNEFITMDTWRGKITKTYHLTK